MPTTMKNTTPRNGRHDKQYRRNRKRILSQESICAICGRPVDKTLKAPDPMSATVDHIIPIAKHGHPTDMNNLQLAHWICNRMKSDKILDAPRQPRKNLKLSRDWKNF